MRGADVNQSRMFSYLSSEERVPADHPLRATLVMCDEALKLLSRRFGGLYSKLGRRSIAPEKLLRALLLQVLYSIRSERMLMEQLEYNLLFRWFLGLSMDERVWDTTVFSKNRERLVRGEIAQAFFEAVLKQAREKQLLSDEHFTVDGTLLEAWASKKSFQKEGRTTGSGEWVTRGSAAARHAREQDGSRCEVVQEECWRRVPTGVPGESGDRESQWIACDGTGKASQYGGGVGCRCGDGEGCD